MDVVSGPVRYFYLRTTHSSEEVAHWPPVVKPLEGPANKVCTAVRLYPEDGGWRAECDAAEAPSSTDPHLVVTRATVLGLLHDGQRGRAEVGLLGVRVVNADDKGAELATHFVVVALPGAGLRPRQPVVVPIDALVLGEYVEQGDYAEAQLELRIDPADYVGLPLFLPDEVILRNARHTIARYVHSINNYSYSEHRHQDMTVEVEAGRVSLYGRVALISEGQQAKSELQATPGVVEVADHLLYLEELQGQVEEALAAKGLDSINVLSEHALIILRGEAPDSKTRYQAEDIAKRIPGVRGVVNDIVVTSSVAR
jgi:hypothetical protein